MMPINESIIRYHIYNVSTIEQNSLQDLALVMS